MPGQETEPGRCRAGKIPEHCHDDILHAERDGKGGKDEVEERYDVKVRDPGREPAE